MREKVLIVGGCHGIGNAIVKEMSNDRDVFFTYYRNVDDAVSLANATGSRYSFLDLSDTESVTAFATDTPDADIFIYNAGVSKVGLFTELDHESYSRLMDINLNSAVIISKEILKKMVKKKNGCIIYISSIWGISGASCEAAYSVSKAGLVSLTKSLAKEYGPSGIRVNCVCPGIIMTDMMKCYSDEEIAQMRYDTPLMRTGKPEDVAQAVRFLSEASFVTGQCLTVDGGFSI